MTELKPCPFCGSEAKMESGGRGPYQTRVGCSECSCTLGYHVSKKRAIEAWNTRAEREVGISEFQKLTGTNYEVAKRTLSALKQVGLKVVE